MKAEKHKGSFVTMMTKKMIIFNHMEVLIKQAAVEAVKLLKHNYVSNDYTSAHVVEHFNEVVKNIIKTTDAEFKKINAETSLNFDSVSNNIVKEARSLSGSLTEEVKTQKLYRTVAAKKGHDLLNKYKSFLESTCEDMVFIAEKLSEKGAEKTK